MTNNNHPITPPPELRKQWISEGLFFPSEDYAIIQAARWGYEQRGAVNEAELQKARDEELEACCEWLETGPYGFSIEATAPSLTKRLRAARCPKPPSLKEQALKAVQNIDDACESEGFSRSDDTDIIRRALESLPD